MKILICEDSLEGIFTAVYIAYEKHFDHGDTRVQCYEDMVLFAEYERVETDGEKAMKVIRTLKRKFGEGDYYSICMALTSADPDKAQAVYQTIVYGLKAKPAQGHLLDHMTDDNIRKTFALARNATREYQHLEGFLRFRELDNGALFAVIAPRNDLIPYLMEHFTDRLPMEHFAVYDEGRGYFGLHGAGKGWYLASDAQLKALLGEIPYTDEEEEYEKLFKYFCQKIAIKERHNEQLQQQLMPLRFQKYTVEFEDKFKVGGTAH